MLLFPCSLFVVMGLEARTLYTLRTWSPFTSLQIQHLLPTCLSIAVDRKGIKAISHPCSLASLYHIYFQAACVFLSLLSLTGLRQSCPVEQKRGQREEKLPREPKCCCLLAVFPEVPVLGGGSVLTQATSVSFYVSEFQTEDFVANSSLHKATKNWEIEFHLLASQSP